MNHKKLRHALISVIEFAENAKCKDLHHRKLQLHPLDEICPAEYELQKQANIVREYAKAHGLI